MLRYWPDDPSGEALRELDAQGFDFAARYPIDFTIDFEHWPPAADFIDRLRQAYPSAEIQEPQADSPGQIVVVIDEQLSYELVISMQASLSALAADQNGFCESWGVTHER